jgi:hypothetical protein
VREPLPQLFELVSAHRAFLGAAIATLRKQIEFAILRQQLDLHARSHFLPWLGEEIPLQTDQAAVRFTLQRYNTPEIDHQLARLLYGETVGLRSLRMVRGCTTISPRSGNAGCCLASVAQWSDQH